MADDFFSNLGKKISNMTQSAIDKTNTLVESSRINGEVNGEKREIDRLFKKIGEVAAEKLLDGSICLGDEANSWVEEIKNHRERLVELKQELATVKSMKICPSCDELIPINACFCPKCGAALPVADLEEDLEFEEGTDFLEAPEEAEAETAEIQAEPDEEAAAEIKIEDGSEEQECCCAGKEEAVEGEEGSACEAASESEEVVTFFEEVPASCEEAAEVCEEAVEVCEETVAEAAEVCEEAAGAEEAAEVTEEAQAPEAASLKNTEE